MKSIGVRELQQQVSESVARAQREPLVITRHGRPVALLVGVARYGWDDVIHTARELAPRPSRQPRRKR